MSKPYYRSRHWRELREAALMRDLFRCVVPGCKDRATHVDHIRPRPRDASGPTWADCLENVQCMCARHHNSKTAQRDGGFGRAQNDGPVKIAGADATGRPLDPNHWWNR